MFLRPSDNDLAQRDFIPQAVLAVSEHDMRQRVRLVRGRDDFDEFVGGAFVLDGGAEFALKHYAGHPPGTFTVYLQPELRELDVILHTVRSIVRGLDMNPDVVIWDRSIDPDL